MSLEDKVEDLGVTINNLTSAINVMIQMVEQSQQPQPQPTVETVSKPKETKVAPSKEEPTNEAPSKEEPTLVTHDELKELLTKFNRQDNGNHKKLKQLLKDNGASKVGNLTDDAVQLVAKAINEGDF